MVLPCAASRLTFNRREDAPVFIIAFEACSKRNSSGSDSSAFVSRTHRLIVYRAKLPWTVHVTADILVICVLQSLPVYQMLHADYA